MLTIEEIKAMTIEEKRAWLEANAGDLYGPKWRAQVSRLTGITPANVTEWYRGERGPNEIVMLLIDAMGRYRQISGTLRKLDEGLRELKELPDLL